MRTRLAFQTEDLLDPDSEDRDVSIYPVEGSDGRTLAYYIAERLPEHGFVINGVFSEDWGWWIEIESQHFTLGVGCGFWWDETENNLNCFIKPDKPYVRRLFRKIDTTERVEALADALDAIVRGSGKAENLTWTDAREI